MGKKKYKFIDCVNIVGKACTNFEGYKRYVSTGALKVDSIDFNRTELVSYVSKPSRANLVVKNGTILFAKMLGTKKTFKIDNESSKFIFSTGFYAVEPNDKLLSAECLYYILCSDLFLKQKDKYCSGATQKAITNQGLEKIYISIPDIKDQKKISKKLDKIIKIIRIRERQIVELDKLIKARFVEMFGDPVENTFEWSQSLLREVTSKIGSGATPRGGKENYQEQGTSFIRSMNVHDGQFEYKDLAHITDEQAKQLENVIVEENDVLINITGASVARSCIVPINILPARVNQHVSIIRCFSNRVHPVFVNNLFLNDQFKNKLLSISESGGATRQAITKQQLENLTVIVPPLELQNEFASFVAQIDKLKFGCCQIIAKSKNIKILIINTITLGRRILYGK